MSTDIATPGAVWTPIGRTSNQLIVYHPPSHALTVIPHPTPSYNATPGPSRVRPPLLLPYRGGSATSPLSADVLCPTCHQVLPGASDRSIPAQQRFRSVSPSSNGRRRSLPPPEMPEHLAQNTTGLVGRSYFNILERAHEGSSPPSPRRMRDDLTPEPGGVRFERDWGREGSAVASDDEDEKEDAPAKGYYARYFREVKRLGMGAEGSVYLAVHTIGGNDLGMYAVKKIAVGNSKEYLLKMLREVKLHETLRHPNIIPYHHSWIDVTRFSSFGPPITALHVLMMYATAGNLDTFLLTRSHAISPERTDLFAADIGDNESFGHLPREERIKAFKRRRLSSIAQATGAPGNGFAGSTKRQRQETRGVLMLKLEEVLKLFGDVVEGLAFLHANSILHLDLKCSNVLLHWGDDPLIPRALISDFGTSEQMMRSMRPRSGHTGTMEYMAPEIIVPDAVGNWRPTDSHADMWSLGMILHKLLFLHLPYPDTEDFEALQRSIVAYEGFKPTSELIFACERRRIPRDMLLLLSKLIHIVPETRPSAEKVKAGLNGLQRYLNGSAWSSSKAGGLIKRFVSPFADAGPRDLVARRAEATVPPSPVQSLLALPGPSEGRIHEHEEPIAPPPQDAPRRGHALLARIDRDSAFVVLQAGIFVTKILSLQPQLSGLRLSTPVLVFLLCLALAGLRSTTLRTLAALFIVHVAILYGLAYSAIPRTPPAEEL